MAARPYVRFALGAALLAAGVAAVPAAAVAESTTPAAPKLVAVTEHDPATGRNKSYPVGRGEDVPAVIGVANTGDAPVKGLVVWMRAVNHLYFPKKYDNCWYDAPGEDAVCEFDDELAVNATLALAGSVVSTVPDARPDLVTSIVFRWVSKESADGKGLLEGAGRFGVRGTGGTLTLEPRSLPLLNLASPDNPAFNVTYATLIVPPTGAPSASPTAVPSVVPTAAPSASPTATPSAAPSTTPSATRSAGASLPVTGPKAGALAGSGAVLLLFGAAAFVLARRRRAGVDA